jgi:hypothetical protein
MPIERTGGGGGGGGRFGLLKRINKRVKKIERDFIRGGENAARGLPTALFDQGKATAHLLRGNPKPYAKIFKEQGRATATTVRHPLRDPFQSTMLALALASGGGGAVARTGAAARTTGGVGARLRAAARKPQYTRIQERPTGRAGQIASPHVLNASPNPILRGARKVTLDPIYRTSLREGKKAQATAYRETVTPLRKTKRNHINEIASLRRQRESLKERGHSSVGLGSIDDKIKAARKKVSALNKEIKQAEKATTQTKAGSYARKISKKTSDQQTRYTKQKTQAQEDIPVKKGSILGDSAVAGLYNIPVNAMRLSMFARPRYAVQNVASTGLMLGAHQPLSLAKNIKRRGQLKKNSPELYEEFRNYMGATGTSSALEGTSGILGGATRRLGEIMNRPEAAMRPMFLLEEIRRADLTPEQFSKLPDTNQLKQRILAKANEAGGDYGRLGPKERGVMRSGIPLFYPMYKALARYTARFPGEHSIISALAAMEGERGFEQQMEDFGGALPPWEPYSVMVGKDRTVNPQNVLPYSPGTDLFRLASAGTDQPTQSLATLVGPNIEFLYGGDTGRSITSGFRLPGLTEKSSAQQEWLAAIKELLQTVPGR